MIDNQGIKKKQSACSAFLLNFHFVQNAQIPAQAGENVLVTDVLGAFFHSLLQGLFGGGDSWLGILFLIALCNGGFGFGGFGGGSSGGGGASRGF